MQIIAGQLLSVFGANIQNWPTPEMFISPGVPPIVETLSSESATGAVSLTSVLYQSPIVEANPTETASGSVSLTFVQYLGSGIISPGLQTESASASAALDSVNYLLIAVAQSELETASASALLASAFYQQVLVPTPNQNEAASGSVSLTHVLYS